MSAADEFAMFAENAKEAGLPWSGPPVVRRVDVAVDAGMVSALRWGEEPHMPWTAADAVAPAIRRLAPDADVVVGMSLGGLTTIRLSAIAPELVRRAVIVDVTPSVATRQQDMTTAQRGTTALTSGPRTFATREEMVALAVAAAPGRAESSVRRGVVHNTRRRDDGRWEWRYDEMAGGADFAPLWEHVSALRVPVTLVRGGASAFVPDADAEEFVRRCPAAKVRTVPGAGHSVQSDAPLVLADLIREVIRTAPAP